MKIGKQLFLTFFLAFLILGGILAFSIFENIQAAQKTEAFENDQIQQIRLTERLKLDVIQVQQFLTDISATRAQGGLDDGFKEADGFARDFQKTIDLLKDIQSPQQREELDSLVTPFQDYYVYRKTNGTILYRWWSRKGK